jgi:hypothetical protein
MFLETFLRETGLSLVHDVQDHRKDKPGNLTELRGVGLPAEDYAAYLARYGDRLNFRNAKTNPDTGFVRVDVYVNEGALSREMEAGRFRFEKSDDPDFDWKVWFVPQATGGAYGTAKFLGYVNRVRAYVAGSGSTVKSWDPRAFDAKAGRYRRVALTGGVATDLVCSVTGNRRAAAHALWRAQFLEHPFAVSPIFYDRGHEPYDEPPRRGRIYEDEPSATGT